MIANDILNSNSNNKIVTSEQTNTSVQSNKLSKVMDVVTMYRKFK